LNFSNSDPPDLDKILSVARDTALEAGEILAEGYAQPKSIEYKGDIDLVTQYDLASEKVILSRLKSAFPDHEILAEESGEAGPQSPCRWYIDPLDGTTNFAHGFPVFCVSIAFEANTESGPQVLVGVVYDPLRGELFSAIKGGGAFLNNVPIKVSEESDINRALVATGFPYNIHQQPEPVLSRFRAMVVQAQGVRRPGSAALDLSYIACGRLDGYWEQNLSPWDTAAGLLLVQEAGGEVTDFALKPFRPEYKEILATNGHLHYTMHHILGAKDEIPPSQPLCKEEG
jgi:myo-inositol-1(or 4)-monophosphatase